MTKVHELLEAGRATTEQAQEAFDELPPASLDFMRGRWVGYGLPTAHPMDGLLELYGWYGKEFVDPDNVHPLLFGDRGQLKLEPYPLMTTLSLLGPEWARNGMLVRIFSVLRKLFSTGKSRARMRMTEHRGKCTATMVYDGLPIHDVFVRVDDDTVLGTMDLKGMEQPFFWLMRREAATAS